MYPKPNDRKIINTMALMLSTMQRQKITSAASAAAAAWQEAQWQRCGGVGNVVSARWRWRQRGRGRQHSGSMAAAAAAAAA